MRYVEKRVFFNLMFMRGNSVRVNKTPHFWNTPITLTHTETFFPHTKMSKRTKEGASEPESKKQHTQDLLFDLAPQNEDERRYVELINASLNILEERQKKLSKINFPNRLYTEINSYGKERYGHLHFAHLELGILGLKKRSYDWLELCEVLAQLPAELRLKELASLHSQLVDHTSTIDNWMSTLNEVGSAIRKLYEISETWPYSVSRPSTEIMYNGPMVLGEKYVSFAKIFIAFANMTLYEYGQVKVKNDS
jgi:hypothetical protein